MTNRNNVHIVQRTGGWGSRREGGQRSGQVFDTQARSIEVAREMACQGQGEVLIHSRNGRSAHGFRLATTPYPLEDSK